MSTHHCCQIGKDAAGGPRRPASRWRRGSELLGWLLPTTVLALLPKCPACLAAYVALASGLSLSLSTATSLRIMLLVVSAASLAVMISRRLRASLTTASTSTNPTHYRVTSPGRRPPPSRPLHLRRSGRYDVPTSQCPAYSKPGPHGIEMALAGLILTDVPRATSLPPRPMKWGEGRDEG